MKSLPFLSMLIASLLTAALNGAEPVQQKRQTRVLIIGMDGTRPDALTKAHTPNLDALIDEGASTKTAQILGDRYQGNNTISGPGWSSILTGVWADKHGVQDNKFTGKNYELFPHFFRRLKSVRPEAKTVSLTSWEAIHKHILSDADISHVEQFPVGMDAETDKEISPEGLVKRENARDTNMAANAARILIEEDPHAMFVYFHQVDGTGHKIGFSPEVPEYVQAIENVDSHIGTVLEALRSRPNFDKEDWLTIVCTDHGGIEKTHSRGHEIPEIRNVFLIVHGQSAEPGPIAEQAYLVDVAVTALTHLIGPVDSRWQLDGKPVGLKK